MKPVHRRIREIREHGLRCAVEGCFLPVDKVSVYCRRHDDANWRTGSPIGRVIHTKQLRPYVDLAAGFVRRHRQHPGISAACDYLGHLLTAAVANDPEYLHGHSPPAAKLARWLCRVRTAGIPPEEILAVVIALYLMARCEPRHFPSSRFMSHQLAIRVLRLGTARWGKGINRRGEHSRVYDRVPVQVRELLAERLQTALEPLAVKAALEIYREMEAEGSARLAQWQERFKAVPVDGSDTPFLDPTTTPETTAPAAQPAAGHTN